MTKYYTGGGTAQTESNAKLFIAEFLGGFPDSYEFVDITDGGYINDGDPYWKFGEAGGDEVVEIGLWNKYRIQISDASGIYGYNYGTSQWVDLLGSGGTHPFDSASGIHTGVLPFGDLSGINGLGGITPDDADVLLIEDQSDSWAKSKVTISDLSTKILGDAGEPATPTQVLMDATPDSDGEYNGTVLEIDTTGCASGEPVYCDGANSVALADADAIATAKVIGVCAESGKVLTHGTIRKDSWSGILDSGTTLTAGQIYYLSITAGNIHTSAPTGSGDVIIVVGIGLSTTTLLVCPGFAWVEVA